MGVWVRRDEVSFFLSKYAKFDSAEICKARLKEWGLERRNVPRLLTYKTR